MSRRLATIPSIGPITASLIAAVVSDGALFRSGQQFAAWLWLTPKAHSSCGKDRQVDIGKQGEGYLRRLLVVGATAIAAGAPRPRGLLLGGEATGAQASQTRRHSADQQDRRHRMEVLGRGGSCHGSVCPANRRSYGNAGQSLCDQRLLGKLSLVFCPQLVIQGAHAVAVTRQAQLRAVELAKQNAPRHLDRNRPATNLASPVGRKDRLRRCGEDRQGWQTVTSKFLARSKACGMTMDRQAHRQNSGRCRGNQQQSQGVSGLDDRQMLNGEAGQLGWVFPVPPG